MQQSQPRTLLVLHPFDLNHHLPYVFVDFIIPFVIVILVGGSILLPLVWTCTLLWFRDWLPLASRTPHAAPEPRQLLLQLRQFLPFLPYHIGQRLVVLLQQVQLSGEVLGVLLLLLEVVRPPLFTCPHRSEGPDEAHGRPSVGERSGHHPRDAHHLVPVDHAVPELLWGVPPREREERPGEAGLPRPHPCRGGDAVSEDQSHLLHLEGVYHRAGRPGPQPVIQVRGGQRLVPGHQHHGVVQQVVEPVMRPVLGRIRIIGSSLLGRAGLHEVCPLILLHGLPLGHPFVPLMQPQVLEPIGHLFRQRVAVPREAPHQLVDRQGLVVTSCQHLVQQLGRPLVHHGDGRAAAVVGEHLAQQHHGRVGALDPGGRKGASPLVVRLRRRVQHLQHGVRRHVRAEDAAQVGPGQGLGHRLPVDGRRQVNRRHAQVRVLLEVPGHNIFHWDLLALQAAVHPIVDTHADLVPGGRDDEVLYVHGHVAGPAARLRGGKVLPHHLHPLGAHAVVAQDRVEGQRDGAAPDPAPEHGHPVLGLMQREGQPIRPRLRGVHRVQLAERGEVAGHGVRRGRQHALLVHQAKVAEQPALGQVVEVPAHPPPLVGQGGVRLQPGRGVVLLRPEHPPGLDGVAAELQKLVVVLRHRGHLPALLRVPQADLHGQHLVVRQLPLPLAAALAHRPQHLLHKCVVRRAVVHGLVVALLRHPLLLPLRVHGVQGQVRGSVRYPDHVPLGRLHELFILPVIPPRGGGCPMALVWRVEQLRPLWEGVHRLGFAAGAVLALALSLSLALSLAPPPRPLMHDGSPLGVTRSGVKVQPPRRRRGDGHLARPPGLHHSLEYRPVGVAARPPRRWQDRRHATLFCLARRGAP
eukprot:762921-Hanusia_phi.AAC.4